MSGSMDTTQPGAFTLSWSMSPSPVTLAPTSRFISLTEVFRSSRTLALTAASSTVSFATVPLATWIAELGVLSVTSLIRPARVSRLPEPPSSSMLIRPLSSVLLSSR